MKRKFKGRLIFVLAALLAASLCMAAVGSRGAAYAETEAWKQTITYQGQENWYYFSGDFSEGDFIRMAYSQRFAMWQGQEENNRIFIGELNQIPTAQFDAVRAKVLSKSGKLSVTGTVERFVDPSYTGTEVAVSIVLAKGGDLSQAEYLLPRTVLGESAASVRLTDGYAVENVSAEIGDIVFLVAEAAESGVLPAGAIFKTALVCTEETASGVPAAGVPSRGIEIDGEHLSFAYDNNGNSLEDTANILKNAMMTDQSGNLQYVYQPAGLYTLHPMEFAGWDSPGSWYTMPNTASSVGAVWTNKFYTNPAGGYGFSGLRFRVPADGVLSVVGAYARSSAAEVGDGGLGAEGENASWTLIRVKEGEFRGIASDKIVPDEIRYFKDIANTQGIRVSAGEQIFLRYEASAAWKTSCITALFDYCADPVDINEGWKVSGDVSQETYDSVFGAQGEGNWYYAYGDAQSRYMLFDALADGAYAGKDVYSSFSIRKNAFQPSTTQSVMKVFKAVGSGSARIVGNAVASDLGGGALNVSVYLRPYGTEGWGACEPLCSAELSSRKNFTEFNFADRALNNGDLVFFVVSAVGDATGTEPSVDFNVYVDFTVSSEAEEVGVGIGETDSALRTDCYFAEQGTNGWFYAYGSRDNYVLMTRGFGNVDYERWNGPEWNTAIESSFQCLGAYTGTMRIFVADRAGTLTVSGKACVVSSDGTAGILAGIYHNGETVWSEEYENADRGERAVELSLKVDKGDVIMFYAENKAGDRVAYSSRFFYNLSYLLESDGGDIALPEELIGYLSPKNSYAEFLGIVDHTEAVPPVRLSEEKGCTAAAGRTGCLLLSGAALAAWMILKRREQR